MLAPGTTFASYEVVRRLAAGGMGEVYLCRHRTLDRLDAVKVLRPHLAAQDTFRLRFEREALSAARLNHPNVVTVYSVDEADGVLFLAMRYVPGEDLSTLLGRHGRLDPARTVRLLEMVADALDAAHAVQLVHRDIKPSNLRVTQPGTAQESVVLVDFGISRPLDTDSQITRTGEIVGTIAYCAPEQVSRERVDGACDQYALACVAYECLTGEVPFPAQGQLAVMAAHLTVAPPRLTALRPDLPAAADAVIARGMAKTPAARYASCTEFMTSLRRALLTPSAADHPDFPAPDSLLRRLAAEPGRLLRAADHPDLLALRVGWAGRDPVVLTLRTGPVALRADGRGTASSLSWLLAQVVTRHAPGAVCLAVAVAPQPEQDWGWLAGLAHTQPGVPPLTGPHVATTAVAAADLVDRLRGVAVEYRLPRAQAAGDPPQPRLLAVLDERLGVADGLAGAPAPWVHVLTLLGPDRPVPADASTLDVSLDRHTLRLTRPGYPPVDGVPDQVRPDYARLLPPLG